MAYGTRRFNAAFTSALLSRINPIPSIDTYIFNNNELTPWLMETGGSMPHSQGLSNNSYPEPNQPNSPH